jgi:hypothetical protein
MIDGTSIKNSRKHLSGFVHLAKWPDGLTPRRQMTVE